MAIKKTLLLCSILLVILFLASCPGKVEITPKGEVTIKDVKLPEGCLGVQFKVKITQDNTKYESTLAVEDETLNTGRGKVTGINFRRSVKIRVEVTHFVGENCDPFITGNTWEFEGIIKDESGGKYSVSLSQFKKVN